MQRVRRILGEIQDLMDCAQNEAIGTLRLGVIPTIAPYLMPAILKAFQKQSPTAQLQVRETQTARLIEELEQGNIELVLAALPIASPVIEVPHIIGRFGPYVTSSFSPTRIVPTMVIR